MDYPEALAVFLEHAEPAGTVARVRRLVDPTCDLFLNDRANLVVQPRRNGYILQRPRSVRDRRYVYRREEVAAEPSAFAIVPRETQLLLLDEVIQDVQLRFVQEGRVLLAHLSSPLLRIADTRRERRWVRIQGRHARQWVSYNASPDAELLWEIGLQGPCFECNRLVLLLRGRVDFCLGYWRGRRHSARDLVGDTGRRRRALDGEES